MKSDPDDIEELVETLRADLPTERDRARVKARLAGLGVVVGTGLTATKAAASLGAEASAEAAAVGFWSQVTALSWGAKVGLAAAVSASAVAGPYLLTSDAEKPRSSTVVESSRHGAPSRSTLQGAEREVAAQPSENRAPGSPLVAPAAPAAEVPPLPEASLQPTPAAMDRTPVAKRGLPGGPSAFAVSDAQTGSSPARVVAAPNVASESASTSSSIAARSAAFESKEEPATPAATFAPSPAPVVPQVVSTTLAEETSLIDAALSSLRTGDLGRAGVYLDVHQRKFPHGHLWRERERARSTVAERMRSAEHE
jgi:hypothetical protein